MPYPTIEPPNPFDVIDAQTAFLQWLDWIQNTNNVSQYYMDQATIDKIRGHKLGQRKLATVGALARINAQLADAGPDLAAAVAGDQGIITRVAALNAALTAFLTAIGLGGIAAGQTIEIAEFTSGQIPTSVWFGRIDIPTGNQTQEAQVACDAARDTFADVAGQLRARLAIIVKAIGTLNDLGNSDQKPNKGGSVGDPAHHNH